MTDLVHTVLGPVPADDLGVVAVHEALLSVLPGASTPTTSPSTGPRSSRRCAALLVDFREAGGGTVVDGTGMFHGRDVRLLEALSRATGVHVVASTGQGPEALLGGYFLTPQTNPPTPWPAEKWADMFTREVDRGHGRAARRAPRSSRPGRHRRDPRRHDGHRREPVAGGRPRRRSRPGCRSPSGPAPTRSPSSRSRSPRDCPPHRLLVADAGDQAAKVADLGAYVVLTDPADVVALAEAGHAERVLLATGGVGLAFGHDAPPAAYAPLVTALPGDSPTRSSSPTRATCSP